MTRRRSLVGTALVALLAGSVLTAPPAAAATGFHIENGRLHEANGNEFVMRGVNHPHTWFPGETGAFADIKALGANTVRVVLSSGDRWTRDDPADVANVVSLCKENRLICVLEVHDTTGYGEQSGAATLDAAVDYWLSVRDALLGQERYVIVNIGNEPYGNTGYAAWTPDTIDAIQRLRSGGLAHTLMVDAPNWGQDWSFTMRDNAAEVFAADPDRNTVFSVHMYGVFDTAAEVRDYLGRFTGAGLPIVVGEFGHDHSDGDPDEDAILAHTRSLGVGFLGWSWSGNSGGVEYLDMAANFDAADLTPWGERIFHGPDGIGETAREATVYGGGQGDTTPPSTPGTPTAGAVAAESVTLSWAPSTDDTGVAGYDVVRLDGPAERRVASATTTSVTVGGLTAATEYTFAVYARDVAGNRSGRSEPVTVTTRPGSGGSAPCTVGYRVGNQWPGGFQAELTVRNDGSDPIEDWTLRWTFADGQRVTSLWNARVTQTGARVSVTGEPHTAVIPAGGSIGFGFLGTWTGGNTDPEDFTLDGTACAVR
ncbi:mannan endo-1,4-beta-mannosidase [Prauserella shujinwangii]|uniref:Endoglucanase n=1 Tax=Prauserella shujinwangii TaxID=1453103 RepID=A0A2T0M2E0_9PSEU|nr:cellulase family glycosylhydrolase [Prauserella shujinwangii]PRX50923.1 mannan endo-1,4-beta-mannosidase [Prauserella shujinwangii]